MLPLNKVVNKIIGFDQTTLLKVFGIFTLYLILSQPTPNKDMEGLGTEVDWNSSPAIECVFLL